MLYASSRTTPKYLCWFRLLRNVFNVFFFASAVVHDEYEFFGSVAATKGTQRRPSMNEIEGERKRKKDSKQELTAPLFAHSSQLCAYMCCFALNFFFFLRRNATFQKSISGFNVSFSFTTHSISINFFCNSLEEVARLEKTKEKMCRNIEYKLKFRATSQVNATTTKTKRTTTTSKTTMPTKKMVFQPYREPFKPIYLGVFFNYSKEAKQLNKHESLFGQGCMLFSHCTLGQCSEWIEMNPNIFAT